MGSRCGASRERSLAKEEVAGSRTVNGVRDSFAMVQRSPRWFGDETRVWKAVWSSLEASRRLARSLQENGQPNLIFRTALWKGFSTSLRESVIGGPMGEIEPPYEVLNGPPGLCITLSEGQWTVLNTVRSIPA